MRWSSVGRALVAVAIVAGVVLTPVPASAAKPGVPVPVDPLTDLPSTIGRITVGHPNGPSLGKPGLRQPAWVRGRAQVKTPSTSVPTPPKVGTPVTAPGAFAKAAGGANMFAAAFTGGFTLGAEGLKLYGMATGTDPMAGLCGADEWLKVGYDILSFGIGTSSCSGTYLEPNVDVVAGASATVAGYGAWKTTRVEVSNGTSYLLWCGPTTRVEAGQIWFGVWPGGQGSAGYTTSQGTRTICGVGSAAGVYTQEDRSHARFELRNATSGAVIASAPVVQQSDDPLRQSSCTLTWPDGSKTQGFVGQYRESEGFPVGAIDAACTEAYVSKPGHGPDLMPSEIKVGSVNTETGAQTEIATQEVPEYSEDEKKGLDPGDGSGLKLWKINDNKTYSCMTWAIDCANWWTQTSSGTQPQTDTGTYRCTFGGNRVKLNECGPYRFTFNETELEDRTITGADGEPIPYPIPGPVPNPEPGPGPGPAPGVDPAGECWADGWASVANPLDWVLVPVKCALVWAFAPRAGFAEDAFAESSGKWALTMPGRIGGIVATAFDVDPVGGCQGPHVFIPLSDYWDGWVDFDAYPLSACQEPAATVAFWSRLIGGVVLVYLTALGIIRRVSATVNAPGVGAGAAS